MFLTQEKSILIVLIELGFFVTKSFILVVYDIEIHFLTVKKECLSQQMTFLFQSRIK